MSQHHEQENNTQGKIVFALYIVMLGLVIPCMIYFYSTYGGK